MSGIVIEPFRPELAGEFRRLNLEWIERLFRVEPPDLKVLDDPEGAIIRPGGMIFFALDHGAVVGTVALVRLGGDRCELAKMAVAPTHRGRGIGWLLGVACRDWAAANGIRSLYLETSSRLANAIHLYERLGFRQLDAGHRSDYARADVFMELTIDPIGKEKGHAQEQAGGIHH